MRALVGALPLEVFRTRMQALEENILLVESAVGQVKAEKLTAKVAQARNIINKRR